jgi:hypothetical protein
MNSYTVTIKDTDTMIERTVMVIAESPMEAHKDAMFYQINDFDVENISKIQNPEGDTVFTHKGGFSDTGDINKQYERQD